FVRTKRTELVSGTTIMILLIANLCSAEYTGSHVVAWLTVAASCLQLCSFVLHLMALHNVHFIENQGGCYGFATLQFLV
ncbi:MAG: hypothetical protein JXA33_05510, partial [Anaerolineae bacterium]|nr:hypothetical protein [Anaerolineae bacterium]